ncbi:MAG: phosphoribosylaminoimidazole carboxylase [Planctomyces sp.]|nr:phosphoribosylaminoimidazole carboxylase [Planctomyces sp.]
MSNLFDQIPDDLPDELTEVLAGNQHVRIERIVSRRHASPEGFWYDQEEAEWVLLLSGAAQISFSEPDDLLTLRPGDHVLIPAHRRHRVDWTAEGETTVWLAVFFAEQEGD